MRQPPLTQVPTLESVYNNIIICNLLNDHILLLDVHQMLKVGLAHTDKWLQLFKSCHLWAALLLSLKLDVCLKVKPTQLTSVQHVRLRRSLSVSVDFVCLMPQRVTRTAVEVFRSTSQTIIFDIFEAAAFPPSPHCKVSEVLFERCLDDLETQK